MKTTIVKKRDFGVYSHFVIKAPGLAKKAGPGQFVEVKVTGEEAPFWRRPFCICQADGQNIELLIKEVGQGSKLLREKEVNDDLDIIGPLGNAFTVQGKQPAILVGGGFGVAPLLFLAKQLKNKHRVVEVLIGGRCKEDLLLRKEMESTGAGVACTTEDAGFGTKGLVTVLLEDRLKNLKEKPVIYTAGPWLMMAAVNKIAKKYKLVCQVSLEEVMACGLGICTGCVVKVADHYKRVCKDGPVFNGHDVQWEKK